jgi:class 3 adenylate cyclase
MAANIDRRTGLLVSSVIVAAVFVVLLFAVQIVFVRKVLLPPSTSSKGLTSEEVMLYRNSIRNFGVLFDREIRSARETASQLASSLLDDIAAGRMKNVQKEFADLRSDRTDIRHVFFFNRFGRLLAVDPFSEEHHNNIYDFTRYFQYFREKISRKRPSSAVYHYLLDTPPSEGFDRSTAAEQPFVTETELDAGIFGQKLSRPLLSYSGLPRSTARRPLVMFAAGCVSRGSFWGYAGFTMPLSAIADRALEEFPENLFLLYAFTASGHLLYGPVGASEGMDASGDPLVKAVLQKVAAEDRTGFLEQNGRLFFYHKEGSIVYAGLPVKYLKSRWGGFSFKGLPWQVPALFVFELLMFGLIFALYLRRVIRPLKQMVKRYAPTDLGLESGDEISLIGTMLEHPVEPNQIENFLFEPTLNTDLPLKVDEERPKIGVKELHDGPASAVFVSLRNIAELSKTVPELAAKYYRLIYRLALEQDGTVKSFSFNSFMVYFGLPQEDTEHAVKAAAFLNKLLLLTRRLNAKQTDGSRIRLGLAAETGVFSSGKFVFGHKEEQFVLSPLVYLVQKYEGLTADNVAVFSDNFFQSAPNIEDRFIRQRLRIKVRDSGSDEPVDVYVYRI